MENNNQPEKHGSLSRNHNININPTEDTLQDQQIKDHHETSPSINLIFPQTLEDDDKFVQILSSLEDDSNPPKIPGSVENLLKTIEKMITKYDSTEKFGQNPQKDSSFIESLTRVSMLVNVLENEFSSFSSKTTSCLNRASTVLHLAMTFLDGEFRAVLESCIPVQNITKATIKQSSFGNSHQESDGHIKSKPESASNGDEFPGYSSETISNLNRIANAMISSGYEKECCMVYESVRRKAFDKELVNLGFENSSFEVVHRMQWEALEGEIATWISVFKHCFSTMFPSERKLCEFVFAEYSSVGERLFRELVSVVTLRFLNFAEAIVLTKRSADKLFKFLDMYETIKDLIAWIEENSSSKVQFETWAAMSRLGEAVVSSFCDLENSIRRDNGRTPVPSGAVHPLTRYTMNYLKYTCEYKDTLEQVFQQHQKVEGSRGDSTQRDVDVSEGANEDGTPKTSPFSVQLNTVMDLLDENLEMKSKLYRDPALKFVFLMNNGRYILQKIKTSEEIYDMMGANWCRKRSSNLRQYHKGYKMETWSKVLQCLSHEGLQVNGKVAKPILKERFKTFNSMFDEIHKTQSTWVVSDEQLQSELRVSVSAVVIPAYRSFLGRFKQYFSSGRQYEKYIKYQPEDIENLIEGLFDGNPTSMARRRT